MEEPSLFPIDKPLIIDDSTQPLTQTGSLKIYLQLAEPVIFLQGFEAADYQDKPPALLRGCLVLRVLKTTKLKSVSLNLKGTSRTEWPEGLPPKKTEYFEEAVFMNHTWPFCSHGSQDHGADYYQPEHGTGVHRSGSSATLSMSGFGNDTDDAGSIKSASNSTLSLLKRATSPSPSQGRHRSSSILSSLSIPGTDSSPGSNNATVDSSGNIVFQPGDYYYNFEHLIPCSSPESITSSFGSVHYQLFVTIERPGAFKSNIFTNKTIRVVRTPTDDSVEDSEPITISRDWESQLHYDIVIFSKALVLDAYLPMSFSLKPLDKIKLHRIRVYLTESIDYYTKNKKVHRSEQQKKIMFLEHKAPPPPDIPPDADAKAKKQGNLLTSDGYDLIGKDFEFQVFVPRQYGAHQVLHPNTSYSQIKVHHWIKICLRLSRVIDGKTKHYEISIDSPIHVLDPLCSHANTLLPPYLGQHQFHFDSTNQNHESNTYFPMDIVTSPPLSPDVSSVPVHGSLQAALSPAPALGPSVLTSQRRRRHSNLNTSHYVDEALISRASDNLQSNIYKPENLDMALTSPQAIPLSPNTSPLPPIPSYLLRKPSFDPPSFDADVSPPPVEIFASQSIMGFTTSPGPAGLGAATIRDQLLGSPTPHPPHHRSMDDMFHSDVMSLNSIGSGGTSYNAGGFGIVSIMNGNDSTNQQYDDGYRSPEPAPPGAPELPPTYEQFIEEESNSPLLDSVSATTPQHHSIPTIDISRSSTSPKQVDDNDDITSGFQFSGGSNSMPAAVLKSTSPQAQRLRLNQRESRNTSPRGSMDINRSESLHLQVLGDNDGDLGVEGENDGDDLISRISSISPRVSLDASPQSHPGIAGPHDELFMTAPLLPTISRYSNSTVNLMLNGSGSGMAANGGSMLYLPNESRDSLISQRRESSSVDITALYSNSLRNPYSQFQRNQLNGPNEEEEKAAEAETEANDAITEGESPREITGRESLDDLSSSSTLTNGASSCGGGGGVVRTAFGSIDTALKFGELRLGQGMHRGGNLAENQRADDGAAA